jgi:hypothetical protein
VTAFSKGLLFIEGVLLLGIVYLLAWWKEVSK